VVVVEWATGAGLGGESVCDVDGLGFATAAGASAAPPGCPDTAGAEALRLELGLGSAVVVVVGAVVVVVVVVVTSWGGTLGGAPDPNAHPSMLPGGGV
jgi:hypothetical protein